LIWLQGSNAQNNVICSWLGAFFRI